MNKKQWMIPLSALLAVGLAGCANDNRAAMDQKHKNPAQPIGYYSNENHPDGRNGYPSDNDGPFTEMMDHKIGVEDQVKNGEKRKSFQNRDENGNPPNPTKPLANHDRNFFQRDNAFSASDANYHGHLNQRVGLRGTTTTPEAQDNVTSRIKRTVAGVNNVQDVRSVVYGTNIIVTVKLDDYNRIDETRRAIKSAVKPLAGGRSVQVITDDGTLSRDRNRNNDIQHKEHNMQKP